MEVNSLKVKPNVFEYDEYRIYLNDLYCYYKKTTNYFSYRYFSNKAGFKSPNFLKLVIDGQRNLTESSAMKVSKALGLTQAESEFFSLLVFFCQSHTLEEKTRFAKKLSRNKIIQSVYPLKKAQMNYYFLWYYVPLRELVGTSHFQEDLAWIKNQFSGELSEEQIKEALDDLQSMGLIIRNENGKLVQSHKNVVTSGDVFSSLVVSYHKEMIQRSSLSIENYSAENREISGTCIACSQETFEKIKNLVRDFRKDILALAEADSKAKCVYQLNFQLYPLAGIKKRGNG